MAFTMKFRGRFVHCKSPTELEIVNYGEIVVDAAGKIASVRRMAEADDSSDPTSLTTGEASTLEETTTANQFYFPGLIDSHIHASQYPCVGVSRGFSLLRWLKEVIYEQEFALRKKEVAKPVYEQCVKRSLSMGTTTAAYYATNSVESTNALAKAVYDMDQRGFIGRCAMDRGLPHVPPEVSDKTAAESVSKTKDCLKYCKQLSFASNGRVQGIVTPRFALGCTTDALKGLADLLKGDPGLLCQTHISGNVGEVNSVRAQFPEFRSYAAVYDGCGLLTSRTVLGHAVHLTDEEIALVHLRDAGIAHCPVSNLALGSGDAKVRSWLNAGIKVGLGSDVAGGHEMNILAVARTACLVSRSVAHTQGESAKLSFEEALYLATRGGAEVLGLKEQVGYFKEGMQWDACLVEVEAPRKPKEVWKDRIERWLFSGDDRNIKKVWVKGLLAHPQPWTLPGVLQVREGETEEV